MSGPLRTKSEAVTEEEEAAAVAAVQEMLGPGQEVVSVEKNVSVKEEEVLLVNGTPITLEGEEGQAEDAVKLYCEFMCVE